MDLPAAQPEPESSHSGPYRVLARKYRPTHFDELIGQEALVRTLKNAITTGRIAQAYMLTGVRGVGKTTTARIIAKALNYKGPDGQGQPTVEPTDDCPLCRAIAEDRHPDVMEMDAATRTGVDDIREILDGVRYAPSEARYKVYIIDEVHMLSKGAFNALLKTLEEPPPHVIFIFATTEIRKVPVTVLSRCQRFDLKRVPAETLIAHYKGICSKEGVTAEDDALALIARAADGSVRDGLSLMDQAISLSEDGLIRAQTVRDMLGLADRAQIWDVLEAAMAGEAARVLEGLSMLHAAGADPLITAQDLLDALHETAMTKMSAQGGGAPVSRSDAGLQKRAAELAEKLNVPAIDRGWAIVLKGVQDIQVAPYPQQALEMCALRLIYAADLPDPARLLRDLDKQGVEQGGSQLSPTPQGTHQGANQGTHQGPLQGGSFGESVQAVSGGAAAAPAPQVTPASETVSAPGIETVADISALARRQGAPLLAAQIESFVRPVRLREGKLEIGLAPGAPEDLTRQLNDFLNRTTGQRWWISLVQAEGVLSLREQAQKDEEALREQVLADPNAQALLKVFPGAALKDILPAKEGDKL